MRRIFLLLLACVAGVSLVVAQKTVPLSVRTPVPNRNLSSLLKFSQWNALFPHRNKIYTYKAFLQAVSYFPEFLADKKADVRKRELAAFLANIAQETSGGWAEAPGGYFKWGLYYVEEQRDSTMNPYTDVSKKMYPPVGGRSYHGRGPKQLSWNYNYGQFSEAWFGSKDSLLNHPELVAEDPALCFASAIWFWMTPQFPKPSCHDIMTGRWLPTENDKSKGRIPGFGATVNVINGGLECGKGSDLPKTVDRYAYYRFFCNYFRVLPGENVECTNQLAFGM